MLIAVWTAAPAVTGLVLRDAGKRKPVVPTVATAVTAAVRGPGLFAVKPKPIVALIAEAVATELARQPAEKTGVPVVRIAEGERVETASALGRVEKTTVIVVLIAVLARFAVIVGVTEPKSYHAPAIVISAAMDGVIRVPQVAAAETRIAVPQALALVLGPVAGLVQALAVVPPPVVFSKIL